MNYDKKKIKFQTYSWVIGTTSFRVSELKYKIEKQLLILNDFQSSIKDSSWEEQQADYFDSLVASGLAKYKTDVKKGEKEGRQISSSLEYIGLINKDRILQPTAYELLEILKKKEFNYNNIFGVRNDSFFYIKQYLKLEFSNNIAKHSYSTFKIQPFLALIYSVLEKNNQLSKDFFTYILPTIKNYEELKQVIHSENINIDNFLLAKISSMENYQNALAYFIETTKNEDIFKVDNVFMNMNGGKNDLKFLDLYLSLLNYNNSWSFDKKKKFILDIRFPATGKNKFLYELIFQQTSKPTKKQIDANLIYNFEDNFLFNCTHSFDTNFFYLIHLSKWKINLEEYYDLNKRFLGLTDIFIFTTDYVSLDEVAFYIFNQIDILKIDFAISPKNYFMRLYNQLELINISEKFNFNESKLLRELKDKYPKLDTSKNLVEEITKIKSSNSKDKLDLLINNYFDDKSLIELFQHITKRDDKKVLIHTDWDSDVPTIFEYLIGIFWYKISDKQGDLTEFLNLSLDANLLPRRFAGVGKADIIYKYDDHHLLLKATLSDKNTQRKMELEPVSRHLGKYKIDNGESHYAVFIAPYLDPNVLVSFRSYKYLNYYNPSDTSQFTQGLKIIPLDINDLITIIDNKLTYKDINIIFDKAFYNINSNGFDWYNKILKPELVNKDIDKDIQIYKNLSNKIRTLYVKEEIRTLHLVHVDIKKDEFWEIKLKLYNFLERFYPNISYLDEKLTKEEFIKNKIKYRNHSFKSLEDENKKLLDFKELLQNLIFDIKQLNIDNLLYVSQSQSADEYKEIIEKYTKKVINLLGYRDE